MTDDPTALIAELQEQERTLVFASFDNLTAWRLGTLIAERALAEDLPVAVAVRRNGQRLFHVGLPGSSADNDVWLERKMAVVDLYGCSSYLVGTRFRASGGDFDTDSRLDTARFAAHGGAFPVLVRGVGCVGSVAVSGLPQAEDHRVVVESIAAFLAAGA
ncbi:heme-degrading domain-containing protein [Kineococcus gypseus]|uniref:heme-degrading domain-containing protein n=1 Tax=Kineococcus gypseus TaxID=1637102 RepID=UPI003D7C69E8